MEEKRGANSRAEYYRVWRSKNPEKVNRANKRWNILNPEKRKKINLTWRTANGESVRRKRLERNLRWKESNIERFMELKRDATRRYRATPQGAITDRIGPAMRKALHGNKRGRKWESLVGYTATDLMRHLEMQFKEGMGWENMDKWHIDHVTPKSHFNYRTVDEADFKRCWSLENLQPLWAKENLQKHTKYMEGVK